MPPRRLPSLDGLRAVSIALVIVGHAYQGAQGHTPSTVFWRLAGNGGLGVEIFFVISGFLITTLLLEEHSDAGAISLRNFYIRRSFRIGPALWAYLGIVALLAAAGALGGVTRGAFWSAFSFTTNYSPWAGSRALDHTWSLSVEEQFYLLWPAALSRVLGSRGRGAAIRLALALVVLAPVLRVLTYLSGDAYLRERVYVALHTRMDALMFGCLLALAEGTEGFSRLYAVAKHWVGPAALFTLIISPLAASRLGGAYIYTIGYALEGACIALVLLWLVRNPQSLAGRLLNARPIAHIGVISYSLYLWQELMLMTDFAVARHTVLAILCSFVAAEVSYRLVEQPCLRLRAYFAGGRHWPRRAGRPDVPSHQRVG